MLFIGLRNRCHRQACITPNLRAVANEGKWSYRLLVFPQLSFIISLWMILLKRGTFERTLSNTMLPWHSHRWASISTVPFLLWDPLFFVFMENSNISLALCYLRETSIPPMPSFIFMTAMLLMNSVSLGMATYPCKPCCFSSKSCMTTIHTLIFTSMPMKSCVFIMLPITQFDCVLFQDTIHDSIIYHQLMRSVLSYRAKISFKETIRTSFCIYSLNIIWIHLMVEITFSSNKSMKDIQRTAHFIMSCCFLLENLAGTKV